PPSDRGAGAGLSRIDLATGEAEALTEPGSGAYDTAPTLSPDGRWLAFLRSSTPIQTDVYVVDLSAAERVPVALTSEGGWAGPPAFLPEGDAILATMGRMGGARRLLALDAVGEKPPVELAAAPPHLYDISVAADGRTAAGLRGELEIDIYAARIGANETTIEKLFSRPGVEGLAALSPDGEQLAFESFGGDQPEGVWLVDVDGSNARLLTSEVGMLGGPPAWSPDGAHLAVSAADAEGQHVYVITVADGSIQQMTSGPERAFPPRWTRDGTGLTVAIGGPAGAKMPTRLAFPSGEIQNQSDVNAVMVEDLPGMGYAMVDGARDLYLKRRTEQEYVAKLYWRHTFEVERGGIVFLRHNGRQKPPTAEAYKRRSGETQVMAELPGAWRGFTVNDDRTVIYFDREEAEKTGLQWFTLGR
ncbi:MAG: PD40 domain-containing protein, partial [Acidobacteria bacterium]|nr:PD40 domain-containing protein [Acidobacteriota bacterium]